MKIEDIQAILEEADSGIKHCPYCGLPFSPRKANQKTCGDPACVEARHKEYIKEWYARKSDSERKEYKRESVRKYRAKKKRTKIYEENLDKTDEHWKRKAEFDKIVAEHGAHYGEYQKQKILEKVPKIKTEL